MAGVRGIENEFEEGRARTPRNEKEFKPGTREFKPGNNEFKPGEGGDRVPVGRGGISRGEEECEGRASQGKRQSSSRGNGVRTGGNEFKSGGERFGEEKKSSRGEGRDCQGKN